MLFRTINCSIIIILDLLLIVTNDLGNMLIFPICPFVSTWEIPSTMFSYNTAKEQASPGQLDSKNSRLPLTLLLSLQRRVEIKFIAYLFYIRLYAKC